MIPQSNVKSSNGMALPSPPKTLYVTHRGSTLSSWCVTSPPAHSLCGSGSMQPPHNAAPIGTSSTPKTTLSGLSSFLASNIAISNPITPQQCNDTSNRSSFVNMDMGMVDGGVVMLSSMSLVKSKMGHIEYKNIQHSYDDDDDDDDIVSDEELIG
ncbi:hypothetical protein BGX21_009932 [Mortierella sp. AD011]|nr:hypothetical protein BGX21_009932 [Mortierella sp. AD011]